MKLALVLALAALAAPKPFPDVPVEYQSRFKSLVIKQKDLALEEMTLQNKYLADKKAEEAINAEGQELEHKMFVDLKLDPSKYSVSYKDGQMVIIAKDSQ